jgi:hypothetical protein
MFDIAIASGFARDRVAEQFADPPRRAASKRVRIRRVRPRATAATTR